MAKTNADRNPCAYEDGGYFLLDKFMPILDYRKHMHRLVSFICAYVNENLLISGICAIKTNKENMTEESLKGKHMICYANSEGGKWYVL